MAYRLEVFRGSAGLAKVAADWDSLIRRMSQPRFFHLREWYESYLHALDDRPDETVFCVLYANDNSPAALLPLKQEQRKVGGVKFRSLELPRHDHLHLRDILVANEHRESLSLIAIIEHLKQSQELRWDVLALWHALEDSSAMAACRQGAPKLSLCTERFGCYHMTLAPWEEISNRIGKNLRNNLRSAKNRAKKMERIGIETVSELPKLHEALAAFMDVEASGWKGASGTAIKLDQRLKAFYENVVDRFGSQKRCEIHLLRHEDRPIAGLFTLLAGDTVYVPKVAYDEEHSRISPVHLLYEYALRQYEQRSELKKMNLISDASWFDVWKPQRAAVYNIYAFNTTMMGLAVATAMGFIEKWRQRKLPLNEPTSVPDAA